MKKLLSLLLCMMLIVCAVPMAAFADTVTPTVTTNDLADSKIEIEKTSFTFTGKEIKPNVTVKLGTDVVPVTGYDVTYTNNVNVGDIAAVTVKGKAPYSGEKTIYFAIEAKEFSSSDKPVIEITPQKKGSEANTLENATVTWQGNALVAGIDYDVICDHSKVGTQTAKFNFKGNYAGTVSANYDVVLNSITEAGIYLTDLNASYTFNGKAHEPKISVRIGTNELTEGKDYKVSYENNVNASRATSSAKIVVTGMGAYSGMMEKTFQIAPAKISDVVITFDPNAYTATGQPITPTYTMKLGDYTLEKDKDYTVTFSNNIAIGEATATFTANSNFTGTRTEKFQIVSKAISDLEAKVLTAEYTYDGKAKEPAVEVKDGDVVLTAGTDYTVAYEDNTRAGTAKVIITGVGKYGGSATLTFHIEGKPNRIITGADSYTKYLTSKVFNLDAEASGDQKQFTYTSSNEDVVTVSNGGNVTVKGTGKATITIKTSGTTEYNPAEKVVTITVKPLKPVVTLTSSKKKQVKVSWTKQEGATKYQVRYGRNGKYYYRTVKHLDNEFTKTYTYLNNRTSGKTYYIKVRSITEMKDGTVVYGNWSTTKKIKSK